MSLDHRLIALLVCPVCKGPLTLARDDSGHPVELQCHADRLGFPIRDGIPVMLEAEARAIEAAESQTAPPTLPPEMPPSTPVAPPGAAQ